eukprot:CAMPEP_0118692782 /NCGR_PEP_ID=MMETSP0800-20121206/11502_1 /TAXON_ID=210618 ORGANISM="Striatella unipunctata, Strain CCMP2910" /NCGR_SAMPLE_ID=MMETSP0800 /ASSEMBLY_ACC=CAM_ASM_000638 /LENGTH=150 /DNA_ID=CAMNT_0006590861 /DNA_START=509 /DNA_END=961 /DNA_ORIENTATION=-
MKHPKEEEQNVPREPHQATPQQQTKETPPKSDLTHSPTPKIRLAIINAITKPQGRASNQQENQTQTTHSCPKRRPDHRPDRITTTGNQREETSRRNNDNHTKHQEHTPNDNPHHIITDDNQQPRTDQIDAEINRNSTTTEAAGTNTSTNK